MADEIIDICDEDNKIIGQKLKSEAHKKGLWHRSAQIWIYNSKAEILLQLRTKNKTLCPNLWDASVAGHVASGEEPIISALREMEEEIGLKLEENDLKLLKIRKNSLAFGGLINKEWAYIYTYIFDGDINKLHLQKDEVQEVKFISPDDMEKELKTVLKTYVPLGEYWNEMIAEARKI